MANDLLTTAQVAEILGTSVPTVNRLALKGKLPAAHKLPGPTGAYLFHRTTVDAYIASRTPPSEAAS